jgi:hypothetical protein
MLMLPAWIIGVRNSGLPGQKNQQWRSISDKSPWRRGLHSGTVSACGVMGREIDSRQGIGW